MKILIAAGIYPPDAGGPAIHAKAQYEGFPGLGAQTRLVAFAHYRKWPRWIRHLFFLIALLKEAFWSEVIYAHDAWGVGFPALLVAKMTGNKLVVRVGGDMAWEQHAQEENVSMNEWYEKGLYKSDKMFKLSRFTLKHADRIVVIGKSLSNLYKHYYGVHPEKIKIILNPVPETKSVVISDDNSIIFASRLTTYKNIDKVLKVLVKINDVKFVIMGDGPDKKRLEDLTKQLNLENQVEFTGSVLVEEVQKKTATSHLTIAPALTEFNPNYVLQGIALGKPFLISQENDLPFEVPEYLTFDARNESELLERLKHLLTPGGYAEAVQFVKNINFKMTWGDNLRENIEAIKVLLNNSK